CQVQQRLLYGRLPFTRALAQMKLIALRSASTRSLEPWHAPVRQRLKALERVYIISRHQALWRPLKANLENYLRRPWTLLRQRWLAHGKPTVPAIRVRASRRSRRRTA